MRRVSYTTKDKFRTCIQLNLYIIRVFERGISTDFTHPKLIIFLASLERAVFQSLDLSRKGRMRSDVLKK